MGTLRASFASKMAGFAKVPPRETRGSAVISAHHPPPGTTCAWGPPQRGIDQTVQFLGGMVTSWHVRYTHVRVEPLALGKSALRVV